MIRFSFSLWPKLALRFVLVAFATIVPLTSASSAVLISEFMASNSSTYADEDGEYSDWIELYNSGATQVDISGWYLTDDASDLVQWQLPSGVLAPGEHLVVFASSKNRLGPELHTNFKLGAGGEYLGLINTDGTTVVDDYSSEYPPQTNDVSYGISDAGLENFLATPTPGAVNSEVALPRVVFTREPGVFFSRVAVSLGSNAPLAAGEQIYYTIDGTEPSIASSIYSRPIRRSTTTRIRARVLSGTASGSVSSATYIAVDRALAKVRSALPMAVIDTFGAAVSSNDVVRTPAAISIFDRNVAGRSNLRDSPVYSGFAGIRIRGSSSAGFAKKQYKIELWGDFTHQSAVPASAWRFCANQNQPCNFSGTSEVRYGVNGVYSYAVHDDGVGCNSVSLEDPADNQRKRCHIRGVAPGSDSSPDLDRNLLGLGSESDWVLYAPGRYDRSYIANPLMFQLSGAVGLEEMKTQFVEVFLDQNGNGVDSGDYVGLYVLTESIKIGEKRVDIEKLSPSDVTLPEISGGYIIGRDRRSANKFDFRTPHSADDSNGASDGRIVVHRPKLKDLNRAQARWIRRYVLAFEDALYGPDPSNPFTGYAAYIDVPSWIDAHLLRTLAMDPDILRLSNYFYKDRNSKLVNAPLWDFDRTLNSSDSRDDNPQQISAPTSALDPFRFSWWGPLFAQQKFVDAYNTRWNVLRSGPLSRRAIFARIDALHAEISGSYLRETARWGNTAGYGSRYGDLDGEIAALKDWLDLRLEFLDSQFLSTPRLTVSNVSVSEATAAANVKVSLNHASSEPVRVAIYTRSGTAQGGGVDFFDTTVTSITFAPGQIEQTLGIRLVDDAVQERTERFEVGLFKASGAIIDRRVATVAIEDNDTARGQVNVYPQFNHRAE